MASNLILTSCELCSQHFSDPRMLPCLHSFCFECLLKHFDSKKSGYSCPTCNEAFEVPDGKLEALTKDLHGSYVAEVAEYEEKMQSTEIYCDRCIDSSESAAVKFCCNCSMFLCSWCTKDHTRLRKTHKHELVDVGEKKGGKQDKSLLNNIPRKVMNCQLHSDEALKFYCTTCSCLVCRDCVILSHSGHSYDRIEATAEKEKEDLLAIADKTKGIASKLEDAMAKGEKIVQNIKARQLAVDGEIKECFENLHAALHHREESLLAKSSEVGLTKITALMLQIEEMKKIHDDMTRVYGCIEEAIGTYTPAEILAAKKTMTDKLTSLTKVFDACSLDPCKNDVIVTKFETLLLMEDIEKLGTVTGGCYAAASTASLYIPLAIKGRAKKLTVMTKDIQGKQFYGSDIVIAQLGLVGKSDFDVKGKVKNNEDGTYEVSITPQATGEHQLDITIGNEHIKGSPFLISVREERPYTSLRCLQNISVSYPWDVAFSDAGEMFVADYSNCRIQVVNQQGTILRTIGASGTGNLQFSQPSAIAIRDEMVYVAEEANNRIQKFTTSGKYISTFGSYGSGEGQLYSPRGICIDPDGKIYVSEFNNSRISVFNADESFNRHISGNLSNPWGLAFDSSGNLHVANYSGQNIVMFSSEGNYYIRTYGSIQSPSGIAIDPEGYVFVGSYANPGSYHVFSPQLQLLNTYSGMRNTAGVTLDKDGCVYVCDYSNNRVSKH